MKRITFAIALLVLAAPAWANGVHTCTTVISNANFCELGDVLLVWDAPPAVLAELTAALPGADLDVVLAGAMAYNRRVSCTAGAVTLGICRLATNDVISISLKSGILSILTDDVRPAGFDTVRCSLGTTQIYPGTGSPWSPPISRDLVATGTCTAEQIGQQVANPISAELYAWKWYFDRWRDLIVEARRVDAVAAAEDGVDGNPDFGDDSTGGGG